MKAVNYFAKSSIFFLYLGFLSRTFTNHSVAEEVGHLTSLYHFHPLHDILQKKLQAIDQIRQKKKRPDTDSVNDFIARSCATNINKELIELVVEELITQNVIFNKTNGLDSFYKLNEKIVPLPTASCSIEVSEPQPSTSNNEILEHS